MLINFYTFFVFFTFLTAVFVVFFVLQQAIVRSSLEDKLRANCKFPFDKRQETSGAARSSIPIAVVNRHH